MLSPDDVMRDFDPVRLVLVQTDMPETSVELVWMAQSEKNRLFRATGKTAVEALVELQMSIWEKTTHKEKETVDGTC